MAFSQGSSPEDLTGDAKLAAELMHAHYNTPNLVSFFNRDDILLWANPAFREAFGVEPDEFLSWTELMINGYKKRAGSIVESDNFHTWLASAASRRGKEPFRAFEANLHDGRFIWMTETVNEDGSMLCIACDISSLRPEDRNLRLERDMAQRASLTDPLTGISNRSHIVEQLGAQLNLVKEQGTSCGIAIIDLDFFKKINDRFGHPGGDLVLQHFVEAVRNTLRREDAFGRIGGEEFMVLLPDICERTLAERLQHIIETLPQKRPFSTEPDFFYTCSIGGSLLQATDSIDSAIHRIDEALYQAKKQGRNRLIMADPNQKTSTSRRAGATFRKITDKTPY